MILKCEIDINEQCFNRLKTGSSLYIVNDDDGYLSKGIVDMMSLMI